MHKRSAVLALPRQVAGLAAECGGSRGVSVRERAEVFNGVEPDLLMSAYDGLVQESSNGGGARIREELLLKAVTMEEFEP